MSGWRRPPVLARIPGWKLVLTSRGEAVQPDYPAEFEPAKAEVRRRAGGQCERCPIREGDTYIRRDPDEFGNPIIMIQGRLQIAHLSHDPLRCGVHELQAVCNRCHGLHDKRHHDGVGAVTGAMWGTLTGERGRLIFIRLQEGAAATGVLEPGEVEYAAALALSWRGRLAMKGLVRSVQVIAGTDLDEGTLREQLAVALQKLLLRRFAVRDSKHLIYNLDRPMWVESSEEAA